MFQHCTLLLATFGFGCSRISDPSVAKSHDASAVQSNVPSGASGAVAPISEPPEPLSAGTRSTLPGAAGGGGAVANPSQNAAGASWEGVGTVDQPCAREGVRACTGNATLDKLVCTAGRWTRAGYCDGNNRCDTSAGPTQGSCQPIVAACLGAQPNDQVCDGKLRKRCGRDLVRVTADDCSEHAHCSSDSMVRCICDDGFRDQSGVCKQAATCPAGACQPGGRCVANDSDYTCMCNEGFEGTGTPACVAAADACARALTCSPEFECVGKSGDYTCRGQFADWPMPDTAPGSKVAAEYIVSPDGETIVDDVTKLTWQATIPLVIPGCPQAENLDRGTTQCASLAEASRYCSGLVLGGYSDWRVPSKIELESLLDLRNVRGGVSFWLSKINSVFGTGGVDEVLFTSTPFRGPAGGVWQLRSWLSSPSGSSARVRCVRGP